MLRITLATLHLLALALGLGAVFTRSAVLWLATGLWRLIAHTEKNVGYYFDNLAFIAKMGGFILIVLP